MAAGPVALIIGAGPGISAAFASDLRKAGYRVALAARNAERVQSIAAPINADAFTVDAGDNDSIVKLFADVGSFYGADPEVVLYNAGSGFQVAGDCGTVDYSLVAPAIQIAAVGAFVAGHEAGKRMIPKGKGAIFFTGATAGLKTFPKRTVFAMGKFALRALAQSLYKELSPQGIHVCHFVIDGAVRSPTGDTAVDDAAFTPENISKSYMAALHQPKGAWSWEMELRSKDEKF